MKVSDLQQPDVSATRPLNLIGIGCRGCVVAVMGEADLRRRLLEMGFCNGACVEVVRRAPLGDPIEFRLRGYHLSLRADQARNIHVRLGNSTRALL
jgi:Fe2+ transport system protein FeoA